MTQSIINPNLIRAGLLAFTLPLFLAGCPQPTEEPPEEPLPEAMPPEQLDHELTVTLPDDARLPPAVSKETLHVRGGSEIEIVLNDEGNRPNQAATVLKFERGQEAFVDERGQPRTTVVLSAEAQRRGQSFTVRPHGDGVCHRDAPCKYDVINRGNRDRPVLDPEVIIYP